MSGSPIIQNGKLVGAVTPPNVVAILGISFITFSAISYLVDIYKGYAATVKTEVYKRYADTLSIVTYSDGIFTHR